MAQTPPQHHLDERLAFIGELRQRAMGASAPPAMLPSRASQEAWPHRPEELWLGISSALLTGAPWPRPGTRGPAAQAVAASPDPLHQDLRQPVGVVVGGDPRAGQVGQDVLGAGPRATIRLRSKPAVEVNAGRMGRARLGVIIPNTSADSLAVTELNGSWRCQEQWPYLATWRVRRRCSALRPCCLSPVADARWS